MVLREEVEAETHELVVVGLVARGTVEFGNSGHFGEGDPDFGDEDAFEVEAEHVHGKIPLRFWNRMILFLSRAVVHPESELTTGNE